MLSLNSFNGILHRLGLPIHPEVFESLMDAYQSPNRHYHNTQHIAECLRALEQNKDLAARSDEVALALWFHDAIYDTQRYDNEERSANWARNFLERAGLDDSAISRIHALIIATKHTAKVEHPDQQLLVDIDLGIFGQSATIFANYDAAIRREYHWVTELEYRAGRISILQKFLDRRQIYHTERFTALYEQQARENIVRAIANLKQAQKI